MPLPPLYCWALLLTVHACHAGAYLLGVMPPELIKLLGLNIPLVRRDPHYFLPTTGECDRADLPISCRKHVLEQLFSQWPSSAVLSRVLFAAAGDKYLLFGSDEAAMKQQFLKFFSQADWEANQRLQVRGSCCCCCCCFLLQSQKSTQVLTQEL